MVCPKDFEILEDLSIKSSLLTKTWAELAKLCEPDLHVSSPRGNTRGVSLNNFAYWGSACNIKSRSKHSPQPRESRVELSGTLEETVKRHYHRRPQNYIPVHSGPQDCGSLSFCTWRPIWCPSASHRFYF